MDAEKNTASMEMPKYQGPAGIVHALKIKKVAAVFRRSLLIEDDGFAPVVVSAEFMRQDPQPGGYYVVCEGGAKAYMTAEDFEGKYKPLKQTGQS